MCMLGEDTKPNSKYLASSNKLQQQWLEFCQYKMWIKPEEFPCSLKRCGKKGLGFVVKKMGIECGGRETTGRTAQTEVMKSKKWELDYGYGMGRRAVCARDLECRWAGQSRCLPLYNQGEQSSQKRGEVKSVAGNHTMPCCQLWLAWCLNDMCKVGLLYWGFLLWKSEMITHQPNCLHLHIQGSRAVVMESPTGDSFFCRKKNT